MQEVVDRLRVKAGGDEEKESELTRKRVMTTNLIDQKLELDDSSTALMLTVALHTRTAEAKSRLSQRKPGSSPWSSYRKPHRT